MREILFRGKAFNGEWEYGVPVFSGLNNELAFMKQMHSYDHQFIPETVGQYTGLIDKNGKKIFEGDIVKIHYDGAIWGNNREVVFEEGQWFFKDSTTTQKSYIGAWGNSVVEVIGNIHDNPELLKEC